ncbi:hypothetical protein HPB48_005981 [Haemaphysalis longicornis]|uniref:Uncharacterized protein n=1 Tax=Haemaphysalis longicornis TaxID=44386 RepID=A0A9J6FB31_HAELO|nr:hypothetical protein HPB48_005981 [Haemaphysalis longicornis]
MLYNAEMLESLLATNAQTPKDARRTTATMAKPAKEDEEKKKKRLCHKEEGEEDRWCCWACPSCFCSVCPAKSTGEGASRGGKAQLCSETLLATTVCPSPLLRRMQLTLFDSILFAADKKKMMVSPRERCAMRARRRAVGDVERPASVLMT